MDFISDAIWSFVFNFMLVSLAALFLGFIVLVFIVGIRIFEERTQFFSDLKEIRKLKKEIKRIERVSMDKSNHNVKKGYKNEG